MNKVLIARMVEKYGTQSDFAHALGIREGVVSQVIHGRRTLQDEEKQRWARALGAEFGELFGEDEALRDS
jgi:transcriptional regulator with XRE-family HTH domain